MWISEVPGDTAEQVVLKSNRESPLLVVEIIIPIAFLLVAFETMSGHGDLLFPSSASVVSSQLPFVVELVIHPPPMV